MADGFLSRWSKRKAGKQDELVEKKLDTTTGSAEALEVQGVEEQAPPPVTLEDVEKIDRFDPDFSAFMKPDVDPAVQQAALKKMFTDPHFNIMDGLDIYIDDYSKPDPLPPGMLERMVQSDMLNLFRKSEELATQDPEQDNLDGQTPHPDRGILEAQNQSDLTSPEQNPTQLDNASIESEPKKT
jgi:hypothetical protein